MDKQTEFFSAIFLFITPAITSFNYEECSVKDCAEGPIRFYEDMYCKPIYEEEDDCCPREYDCSHVTDLELSDYCYLNNKTYSINETLAVKDLPPYKKNCFCDRKNKYNTTNIECEMIPECVHNITLEGNCYFKYRCDNQPFCPKNPVTCTYEEKEREEGETFISEKNPLMECTCVSKKSKGKIKPYLNCTEHKNFCKSEFLFRRMISEKYAPFYFDEDEPQKHCPAFNKIYRPGDRVKISEDIDIHDSNCTFGPLSIPINGQLRQYNRKSNEFSCAKCKCLIPPSLTCQIMLKEKCKKMFNRYKQRNSDRNNQLENCTFIDTIGYELFNTDI